MRDPGNEVEYFPSFTGDPQPTLGKNVSETRGSRAWFPFGKESASLAKKMDFRFRNICLFIFLTFSVIISPGEYYHVTFFAASTAIILV